MKRTADRLFGAQYKWSVLGAGRNQLAIAAMAAAMGGNVRVGLEDSLWSGPGKLATSSAEQVRAARQIIEGLGLSVASRDEAREIRGLKGGDRAPFGRGRRGPCGILPQNFGVHNFLSRASSGGWLKATTQVGGNPRRAAVAN